MEQLRDVCIDNQEVIAPGCADDGQSHRFPLSQQCIMAACDGGLE